MTLAGIQEWKKCYCVDCECELPGREFLPQHLNHSLASAWGQFMRYDETDKNNPKPMYRVIGDDDVEGKMVDANTLVQLGVYVPRTSPCYSLWNRWR